MKRDCAVKYARCPPDHASLECLKRNFLRVNTGVIGQEESLQRVTSAVNRMISWIRLPEFLCCPFVNLNTCWASSQRITVRQCVSVKRLLAGLTDETQEKVTICPICVAKVHGLSRFRLWGFYAGVASYLSTCFCGLFVDCRV